MASSRDEEETSPKNIKPSTYEAEEENDNPIEQVRLTVPITDDPSMSALTFRTWVLGLSACIILSFVNKFFGYRANQLSVTAISAQIVSLPLGKLMAATLPCKDIKVPFTKWSFSLNPGPFNMKEHVLITIFASSGSGGVYAIHILTIIKAFYRRGISLLAAYLLSLTTQMLGYGWAGLFRKYLVDSPYMWWPANLIQVSVFRALHENEKRPKGRRSQLQFFLIVFICSFAYYLIPGYLFPSISTVSIACLIWKNSIIAQQIGSGLKGLGIGSFGLDWGTVASFLSSPLPFPAHAIFNTLVGFILTVYVALPLLYWNNAYEAKRFPLVSSKTFDADGHTYNITKILNEKTFDMNLEAYEGYSKLYLSVFFALTYGLSFAALTATISHVGLFHGKEIWQLWKKTSGAIHNHLGDVHTRIMKRNYDVVPQWWFHVVLICTFLLAIFACEGFGRQLQLPWWGLVLACLIALVFTLPIGVITATTNIQPGLNVITELIIGYLYPGKPIANVAFKTYGYISMIQALTFLQDFKLGHYMKIPPKSMFIVQLASTVVASSVYFGTAWWLLTGIENICRPELLPEGSPWTCPGDDVFYSASIIWGVIGPGRMFTTKGIYPQLNWFFLVGFLAPVPVWFLARRFPHKKWIKYIIMPVIIGATQYMPPAKPVHYIMWCTVGIFFNYYVYNRHKGWWARHNYILSAGLDAGVAFMGIILFFALQSYNIFGPVWWGDEVGDHCKVAECPTAPGIAVKGCPVI